MSPRVLFVYTSANKTLTGSPTGWWMSEAAHLYYLLQGKVEIDFASPKGPNPPVDEFSTKGALDDESARFWIDAEVREKLASAKKLADVDPNDYDAVFYVGGHGPMLDLATDPDNIKLADAFFQAGKITSAVCHGPGALVGVTDASGKSIFASRNVTGLSNSEEEIYDGKRHIPFLLEDRIKELGGKYSKGAEPFAVHVVVDGNVITGQNPSSARAVGEAILKALS
ncbi:putative chaperone protein HSP31 OS=Saccharomyces cerevisiae (strain ATCC 204508 / S288c) GN=HSP31 PE=1 SV=1 [Rhizoctonia solani AG-1 IB]|uniref:D-lactate dehydratase n=1 Tax=Thanatephorus cucumeris (strain AG1-IB / isolate 7/3/14) TaxID=1108050 RepID=M5BN28_THACB|nr:putative chaperone protein HSP31 [Rhizoctonia solani AG-1 IB]CEL58453.1 putative chaperone protein HSP31 OS=Saccharomyces cerevisiae (strain ATCC 204508 / S288c) GN=HSP31 PE=1 SV=1 [Rhizoctonia solani AG-1 IB]